MVRHAIKIEPVIGARRANEIRKAAVELSRALLCLQPTRDAVHIHYSEVCRLLIRLLIRLFAEAHGLDYPAAPTGDLGCDDLTNVAILLRSDGSLDFHSEPVDTIGETYEWLLKQHPSFSSDGSLVLRQKTTKVRKHSGSYYTPPPLVSALLGRSLDPLLRETDDPLSLRILDPSVGSGRFLLAIARRISACSGIEMSKVIGSCLYGADTNPAAVEVCIASLCLEAGNMSLASVLSTRILVGNLLLGTSVEHVSKGIPDEAYQAHDGDDPKICRALRVRNAEMRDRFRTLTDKSLDAWCAAFVQRKSSRSILSDALLKLEPNRSATKLAEAYRFLHPELAFSEVMLSEKTRGQRIPRLPLDKHCVEAPNESDVQGSCRRDAGAPSYVLYEQDQVSDADYTTASGFDLVIGNPPYVPLYSRKSAREDKQLARSANLASYLNRDIEGEPALSGRTNTFLLFLSLGARLVKKGGTVAYVLPDSFATNESYDKTRRVLIERGWLKSFTTYTKASFGDTAVRTSLLVWQKGKSGPTAIAEAENTSEPQAARFLEKEEILSRQGATLKLKAAGSISEGWIRLGDIAEIRDGVNPGSQKTRRRIIAPNDGSMKEPWKPAIVGNDIDPMMLKGPSIRIHYSRESISQDEKRAGTSLRDPRIFETERIVYRQTANRPIACLCPAGIYTLNSVHNVLLKQPNADDLEAICAYLNTDFCARIYADMTGETRNLFPQVHASSMRLLPVPQDLLIEESEVRHAAEISIEKLNDLLEHLFRNPDR